MSGEFDRSRRDFLQASLAVPAVVSGQAEKPRRLKIVCVGAHPDDPESGCGGTLLRYIAAGHAVTIVYLTRGERGIEGKSLEQAATIRTAEAQAACKIIGAKAVFAGQIDGDTAINRERIGAFVKVLSDEAPDIVFAHWPVDAHIDHQVAGMLAYRAFLRGEKPFELYFYEVETGSQTMSFAPTDYVDITSVRDKKVASVLAHVSQDPEEIYRDHHQIMEEFRGREAGVRFAEAFVRVPRNARFESLPL